MREVIDNVIVNLSHNLVIDSFSFKAYAETDNGMVTA